jgi:hypothetical protein
MRELSKAEAIMNYGGISQVRKILDTLDADLEPCEYGHFDCSRVEHGPCSDELMGIFENQKEN